jgi:hypothetical protein
VIIFDNLEALCPNLPSSNENLNIIEFLKSSKISKFLQTLSEEIKVVGVSRHYMNMNTKILDIGCFDTLIEMMAPSKVQRYDAIKDYMTPEQF